jgi:integrase
MSDGNILRRHRRPAAVKLKMDPKKATWRSLRTSCATWMVEAGANPKDVQGQLRHSRIGTTMEIYAQFVPESQRRAIAKWQTWLPKDRSAAAQLQSATIN